MTIKVTFDFNTVDEAAAFLQSLGDESTGIAAAGVESSGKRGPGRPKKAAEVAVSAAAPAAQPAAQTPAPAATPAQTAAAVPFKAVADVITELADKDMATAKAVLAQFGVQKASDLKPEQFGAVVEAAKKALTPSPAAATSLI
jgi:hypothetical protein